MRVSDYSILHLPRMIIQSLFLENFRNAQNATYTFEKNQTIILGPNGIGKTSILEAITALSTTRPFRNSKKEIFVRHSAPYARVKSEIREDTTKEIEIYWEITPRNQNQCFYNKIPLSPSEYLKSSPLKSVLFSPEEMNIPFSPPLKRRQFLAKVLSPLFPEYLESALKYSALIKQRNKLLFLIGEGKASEQECKVWDMQIDQYHRCITDYRQMFVDFVKAGIQEQYHLLSGKSDSVDIALSLSCKTDLLSESLLDSLQKDIRNKSTSIGAHRDDFHLFLRGRPLEEEGSRGEVRSVILALKFLEKQFVEKYSLFPPLLLLDDVFSELDPTHRLSLISSLEGHQSIITTTDIDLPKSFSENIQTFELS